MAVRVAMVALSVVTAFLASPAFAETLVCEAGFHSYGATDVLDDVVVRKDAYLLLDGTTVLGNIKVEPGGILAASRSTIFGSIRSLRAFLIDLGSCDIQGRVTLERTGRAALPSDPLVALIPPSIDVVACDLAQDLRVEDSNVNYIRITNNVIDGRMILNRNISTTVTIARNRVNRN